MQDDGSARGGMEANLTAAAQPSPAKAGGRVVLLFVPPLAKPEHRTVAGNVELFDGDVTSNRRQHTDLLVVTFVERRGWWRQERQQSQEEARVCDERIERIGILFSSHGYSRRRTVCGEGLPPDHPG